MIYPHSAKVVIIGGGFAGISAGIELEKNGIDYVLLEGSDRLGGRVYPLKHGNSTIQLGAEFINGKDNELYRIANSLGLIIGEESDFANYEGDPTYASGGRTISRSILREWSKFVDPIETSFTKEATKYPSQSVAERFQEKYETWIKNKPTADIPIYTELAKTYMNYYETEWSSPATELALSNFDEWDDGTKDGKSWVLGGNGFQGILNYLTKQLNDSNVFLNTVVETIHWKESPIKVQLKTRETIEADYVIVTVPLGYLKKNNLKLFNPRLSSYKRDVIEYLGFGSLEKIFLEYEKSWWKENTNSIITLRIKGILEEGDNITSSMFTFEPVRSNKNMLMLWLNGRGAQAVGKLSNEKLGEVITKHLRETFDDQTIPPAKNVITHNWKTDPLVLGAYSYITPLSYENLDDSFKDMAAPIKVNKKPVVCFAGEHTHSTMYQTTVGAYESGIREAQRIHTHMKQLN